MNWNFISIDNHPNEKIGQVARVIAQILDPNPRLYRNRDLWLGNISSCNKDCSREPVFMELEWPGNEPLSETITY